MRKLPAALIAALLAMVINGASYSADSDNSAQSAQDSTRHDQPGPATVTDPLEHPTTKPDSATADKNSKAQGARTEKPIKPN
jgi:hypothetical protein